MAVTTAERATSASVLAHLAGRRASLSLVGILALVPYFSTLANFWVADDYNYIFPKDLGRVLGFFDPRVPTRAFYRPLTWTSWALDYDLWGKSPAGWHLTSILMHIVTAACAALIVWVLLDSGYIATITGALFALHPTHPETVSWIGGRADLVTGLFYLPAVLCFALYVTRQRRDLPSRHFYGLALLFSVGAIMGKEMGVTVPVVLLLTDLFLTPANRRNLSYWRGRMSLHLPFFSIVALYGLMRVWLVISGTVTNTYAGPGMLSPQGILDAVSANVLLSMGVWTGGDLVLALPNVAKIAVVLAAVAGAALAVRYVGRAGTYAAAWVIVTALPTYNLAALRWLFIPSFGVCLLAALVLAKAMMNIRLGAASRIATVALLLAWGGAVLRENVNWYSSGEEARSILTQIKTLAPDPQNVTTIYFAGAPSRLRSALLFNTGLPSAMFYLYGHSGVDLHELEQPLPDPVIVNAMRRPPRLGPNPLFMGYRNGTVVPYASLDELVKSGTGK